MTHDFHEDIRRAGPISSWAGGKTVNFVMENGEEFVIVFTDGTKLRLEWVDDHGHTIRGKLRVKSAGTHVNMVSSAEIAVPGQCL